MIQTLIEPFANYNLDKGRFLLTDLILPLTGRDGRIRNGLCCGGVGRVFKIGKQPVNMRAEVYYNAEKPDGVTDWQWSFTMRLLLPE